MDNKFTTPVLMIVFARPDATRAGLDKLRKIKAPKIFAAADAGRHPEEQARCQAARDVLKEIDWPCEVQTLFQEKNLGCKFGVSAGINWFFKHVDKGIILEDDCLPDESFFYFCQELLNKYEHDERIMHISGDNFQQHNQNFTCDGDYYFGRIAHEWGWATWRRAWNLYDITMSQWPAIRDSHQLNKIFKNDAIAYRWGHLFEQHYNPKFEKALDAWDGQWAFACMTHGLSINPRVNLVTNIGFGNYSRRTHNPEDDLANLPAGHLDIPLQHPKEIVVNEDADLYTHTYIYNINRYPLQRIKWFFKSNFPQPYRFLKRGYYKVLKSSRPRN